MAATESTAKEASSFYVTSAAQQRGGGKHDHTIKSLAHQHFADKEEKKETVVDDNNVIQQKCSLEYSPGPGPITTDILNRLDKANILAKDDKLLLAAHILHGIDNRHLQPVHHDIVREALLFKELLQDNTTHLEEDENNNNHGGWIKQGEHHGRHNFSIYYKLNNDKASGGGGGQELSCRLETVTHSDLLVPLLSVLNESELYATWLPNWTVPKLKVVKSEKLRQTGRCSQVVNVETEVPWPLAKRQVILKAVACDNIDSYPEDTEKSNDTTECLGRDGGRIIIRLQSLDCENNMMEGLTIPPMAKGTVRMRVRGGFTIEKCPIDHPLTKCSLQYDASHASSDTPTQSSKDLVLVTFTFSVDPQLSVIPKSFINFFLRTAIGQMWNMFLNVAEAVKEGERPEHSKVIEEKREMLYNWIEERTRVMLEQEVPSQTS